MRILLLSLAALFLVSLVAGWVRSLVLRHRLERGEIDEMPHIRRSRPDGCCGQHEVCERESLLSAVSKEIEYYDDEELDAYRGRPADSYTPEEEEEFEEILTTMRDDEVAGWVRSLQLRGVNLPNALRDEVVMIIGERRSAS